MISLTLLQKFTPISKSWIRPWRVHLSFSWPTSIGKYNFIICQLALSKWFNCNCAHVVCNNRKHPAVGIKVLVCIVLQYVTAAQTISTETFIISVCFPNVYQYSCTRNIFQYWDTRNIVIVTIFCFQEVN